MLLKKPLTLATLAAIAAGYGTVASADEGWQVTLTPYLWVVGIDGDISVRGRDASVSASFSDIAEHLDSGGEFLAEANKGRWVNWVQFDYLGISSDNVDAGPLSADLESDTTMLAAGTGYRFDSFGSNTMDVLVGVRYFDIDNHLSIDTLRNFSGGRKLYDGIIALRPRIALSKYWAFSPTLSVGTGDSDVTWELSPQFEYSMCETTVRFGYRNLNYDVGDENSIDISFRGPVLGVGFRF